MFSSTKTAVALRVRSDDEIAEAFVNSGLPQNRPTLVVVGGASQLNEPDFQQVQSLFMEAIAPIAQKWQAVVVDGGTDVGVMRLMGQARAALDGTFALVGVCPEAMVSLPGQTVSDSEVVLLEPHHTHFVLTPGNRWGAESGLLAKIATHIAGKAPSVTILINGGEVAWEDAEKNVQEKRPLIVVEGSGRTADIVAAAIRREVQEPRTERWLETELLQSVMLSAGSVGLACIIEELFIAGENKDD
jgi:hypothetical protein